jgi:hypothetical protein
MTNYHSRPLKSSDEKLVDRRIKHINKKRNKTRWRREKARENGGLPPTVIVTLPERHVLQYKGWFLRDKIRFALNGYCFDSAPGRPAIRIFRTNLNAVKGMTKGVQATCVMSFLPEEFLIFFSISEQRPEPATEGIQVYYQVEVGQIHYMVDPEPTTCYGLGNFVNCAVDSSTTRTRKYTQSLWKNTSQEMHIANCAFSTGNHINGKLVQTKYPFYYRTIKKVYPGEELLTHPHYGGEHFYPENDIIR